MITTLSGENSVALYDELHKMIQVFTKNHGDMAIEQIDGQDADYQAMYDAVTSLPFLVTKKLVVLLRPSSQEAWLHNAERLMSNVAEATEIILVEPKLDKRTAYYRFLKAASDFRLYEALDSPGLIRWLVSYASAQGGKLTMADCQYLIDRVGQNQQLLKNEIDKLLLVGAHISRASIDLLTTKAPQSTIFELLDAAFSGRRERVLVLYNEQRALKVEPQRILAMVAWQLHIFALVKTAAGRSIDDVAKAAKIHPYVVRKSAMSVRQRSLAELKTYIDQALRLDVSLKSQTINADDALRQFLITISD